MTEPMNTDLLDLATPYALHAVSTDERDDIERWLSTAPPDLADAFTDEVRSVRETMALVSASTAAEPPPHLRDSLLAAVAADPVRELPRRPRSASRWRTAVLAAAAIAVVGLGALGVGLALRPAVTPTTADQVFAAPDVQTVSGAIPGGGTATVVFSKERDAGVLVMNDVPPPKPGTVYQMWLVGSDGPHSAGTMDATAVSPSTTAVLSDLGASQTLAFTVEPPGGSQRPTSPAFAELPLS
ncbi:anti-sigma factor [Mycolicibacterium litorale]|uniref:Anti-sigma-K factor RskA n=1 Tax=Mycolicibacterium litorale TaxID=758802 RepID=A0AAD1MXC0_9MYCO|nr:anti-sigma factor [Mycolicibacterium litorale]MCV7418409.1 anti-sigma factor [Mycolicibacterium litorale]TDY06194.1 anti-sigma-K factor RskA [Mycolicibacterium litorale]BBY19663.1 anti-sigma-K factor RskA [Mycolicibacterium litorale]